jgi:hypothetical protein
MNTPRQWGNCEGNHMTTFEALVSMSVLTLRTRGQWQGGATAYADIDAAVNGCADLLRGDDMPELVSLGLIEMAISEICRRAAIIHAFGEG